MIAFGIVLVHFAITVVVMVLWFAAAEWWGLSRKLDKLDKLDQLKKKEQDAADATLERPTVFGND